MTRDAGDALEVWKALGRDTRPYGDGSPREAKLACDLRQHAPLRADKPHSVHAGTLIQSEHVPQAKMLRTSERAAKHCVPMDIATIIKAARDRMGISQRELAKLIRVSSAAVGQWENGVNRPSIENRVDLSKALDIPFIQLIPEAHTSGEVFVRDPQSVTLVQHFQKLPPPIREALLMQVVALAEKVGRQTDG